MSEDFLLQRLVYHWQQAQMAPLSETQLSEILGWCRLDTPPPITVWHNLPLPHLNAIALALKDDASRHIRIGWTGALARAEQIIMIGKTRDDLAIQALGTLAKGDSLKLVMGRLAEAWDTLEEAGKLYQAAPISVAEREIGWAHTRIGRTYLCVEVGRSSQGYAEAEIAQRLLEQHACWDRLILLHVAWGSAYINDYRYRDALVPLTKAVEIATQYPEIGDVPLTTVYNNLAVAARGVGQNDEALAYFQHVESLAQKTEEPLSWAVARLNIALIQMDRGNYRVALRILLEVEPILQARYSKGWVHVVFNLVECYNMLNRFDQAHEVGLHLLEQTPTPLSVHQYSQLCLWLAQGEVKRHNPMAAQGFLNRARSVLSDNTSTTVLRQVELEEALLALQQGNITQARQQIETILIQMEGQNIPEVQIRVLIAASDIAWQANDTHSAYQHAHAARTLARRLRFAPYEYEAYLHLGKLAERAEQTSIARAHYSKALATLARVYRGLSFTLHADFLSTRQAGFHQLMALELRTGRHEVAFNLLEQGKNYLFWDYLQHSNRLHWENHSESLSWQMELEESRSTHRRLTQEIDNTDFATRTTHLRNLEHKVRTLTERLYLYGTEAGKRERDVPRFSAIQASLPPRTILVAYYELANTLWLFAVTSEGLQVYPLKEPANLVRNLIQQIQDNNRLTCQTLLPSTWEAGVSAKKIRHAYAHLGEALLHPIASALDGYTRLYVVPYGTLHSLPFHLLRLNGAYLIEQTEVVVSPTAALLTRTTLPQSPIYRWMGYSQQGSLPHTIHEATTLHARWGGELWLEENASFEKMVQSPCQVVHVAAHGVHLVDHYFDQSYLELAEGNITSDDLLQNQLACELVTLSSCESGSVTVAPGEELIGFGRALLYAGAGALVTSLWQVRDEVSAGLMPRFYHHLMDGESKATALRSAMLETLAENPMYHPAYWGVFQLMGNPAPLSATGTSNPNFRIAGDAA